MFLLYYYTHTGVCVSHCYFYRSIISYVFSFDLSLYCHVSPPFVHIIITPTFAAIQSRGKQQNEYNV